MTLKIYFYSVQQAAEVLDVPTEKVHGLLRKGKLKAHRDEETGAWMINVLSVEKHLKANPQEAKGIPATTSMPEVIQEKGRLFDFDSLVLVIIMVVTLVAAGYTLLPLLLGG